MDVPTVDVTGLMKRIQQQVAFVSSADRYATEMLEILRDTHRTLADTHRIMARMDRRMERLSAQAVELERRMEEFGMSPERLARMEEAVFNIERATSGVEVALAALPRAVRNRMARAAETSLEDVQGVEESTLPGRPARATGT